MPAAKRPIAPTTRPPPWTSPETLAGLELRRDALAALVEAGRRMPKSAAIEKRALELLDQLRDDDGRQRYLAQRISEQPAPRTSSCNTFASCLFSAAAARRGRS